MYVQHIIAYVFKARGSTGIVKHTQNAEVSIDYLDSLEPGELSSLLSDPPCLQDKHGKIAKGVAATAVVQAVEVFNEDDAAVPLALTLTTTTGFSDFIYY